MFEQMALHDYEELVFVQNRDSGLHAVIAIHDTTLGPAVGGIRTSSYNSFEDALKDALKLSRAMTYKCAAAGLNAGGGKTVVLRHEGMKRGEAFCGLGAFINSLGGRYYAAGDVGTSSEDLAQVHLSTKYVEPLEPSMGGWATARGVLWGLKAAASEVLGRDTLQGIRFAIQGLGNVGYKMAKSLHAEQAELIVTDLRSDVLDEAKHSWGAKIVSLHEIYDQECDVFCPCALGGTINPSTVPRLTCAIVAGCANNQLSDDMMNKRLAERDITYIPDFIINAGGVTQYVMFISGDMSDHTPEIGQRVRVVLKRARERGELPVEAATRMAEGRLKQGKTCRDLHWHTGNQNR